MRTFTYVYRKDYKSVKVQASCDELLMRLLNIVAKWQAGTHDSFIVQNSKAGLRRQEGGITDVRPILLL